MAGKVTSPFEGYFGGSRTYFNSNYRPSIPITVHKYFLESGFIMEACKLVCPCQWQDVVLTLSQIHYE
ncbi:MAG TPA: hypothetical protein PLZ38_13860, partial [Spirochaetota bacterium]|nr:hypothetical protein [Spirochaetota bacterium]